MQYKAGGLCDKLAHKIYPSFLQLRSTFGLISLFFTCVLFRNHAVVKLLQLWRKAWQVISHHCLFMFIMKCHCSHENATMLFLWLLDNAVQKDLKLRKGLQFAGVKRDISDMDDPEEDASPTKKVSSILNLHLAYQWIFLKCLRSIIKSSKQGLACCMIRQHHGEFYQCIRCTILQTWFDVEGESSTFSGTPLFLILMFCFISDKGRCCCWQYSKLPHNKGSAIQVENL